MKKTIINPRIKKINNRASEFIGEVNDTFLKSLNNYDDWLKIGFSCLNEAYDTDEIKEFCVSEKSGDYNEAENSRILDGFNKDSARHNIGTI
ncbi:MAG: PriCT-2 domain-containing protein [bacterium]